MIIEIHTKTGEEIKYSTDDMVFEDHVDKIFKQDRLNFPGETLSGVINHQKGVKQVCVPTRNISSIHLIEEVPGNG
jgi:hypothetical protein